MFSICESWQVVLDNKAHRTLAASPDPPTEILMPGLFITVLVLLFIISGLRVLQQYQRGLDRRAHV